MRPVRSTRSFVPSAQVTLTVHGALAALTALTRGNVSIACSSLEFIPLRHQPAAVVDNPSQRLTTMASRNRPGKDRGVADADLSLEVVTDHVHVRRIVVFGEQHDPVGPKILDRRHGRRPRSEIYGRKCRISRTAVNLAVFFIARGLILS